MNGDQLLDQEHGDRTNGKLAREPSADRGDQRQGGRDRENTTKAHAHCALHFACRSHGSLN